MTADRVELRTERLLLRPWQLTDVDDVFEYASDSEWSRYLPVAQPYTRRSAEEFVAKKVLASWETDPVFAIVIDSKTVGGLGLRIDTKNEISELGYSIARAHWGKGLMPEAARAVIDWAFQSYNLAKIFAVADLRNQRSWRVMEKLGMTREGILRKHVIDYLKPDERLDEVWYGLLREEWEQNGRTS